MSNLLKSKFLLGLMIVAVLFVGVVALKPANVSAADCTITKSLKVGMKGAEVTCLQQQLNVTPATGYFGSLTKAAVIAFQKNHSLPATGLFGALSRAALGTTGTTGTYPAGCTSTSGFSSTTGLPCSGGTTYPAGCTSLSGFSSTTGLPCSGGTTPPVTSGPLSVSLATDNPAAGTVVQSQAAADLAHFAFSGTGTLSSVTLTRTGISDQGTLDNVYIYDGATRLTDGYAFNNSGALTINGLNVAVAGTKTLSVKADVNSTTTSYSVGITLTGYAVTGGTTNAVSVAGNTMYVAASPTGMASASFTTPNLASATSVTPGTTGKQVWGSALQINQRNVALKTIAFKTTGSASVDAVTNVQLFLDGTAVGSAGTSTTISGVNYWMFDMSAAPVTLTTGNHTLEVRADFVKGSNYDVTFALQQASDVILFDSQVGVNITPKVNTTTFSALTAGKMSISKGSVSTSIDSTFNGLTTVTGGSANVTIAKFKLHGYGEDVKVTAMSFTPIVSPANGLQNVAAYFNGSQVGSQAATWSAGAISLTPNSQMIVPAGVDSYLEIKADLRHSADGTNYTTGSVSANLGSMTGDGMNSHTNDIAISGVTGNTLTIQTGVVAVGLNSAFTSQAISPNTANTKIASFMVQNQSSSESVHVTNLQVALVLATAGSTNYSNLKTSETSGSGATPINPATQTAPGTSTNNFSVDFTIAPGTTKTIDVFADIGSTSGNATVKTQLYVTALGSTSNVTLCSPATTGGSIAGCNTGTAQDGQTMTISTGTFGVPTVSTTGTTTGQYIATGTTTGVTNAATAEFKFTATSGSATISELKFLDSVSGKNVVTSVSVGSVSAPMVGGTAYLTGLNIPVPNGGAGVTVDAKMSYAPIGSTGVATTNTGDVTSNIRLDYVKYSMGGTTKTMCPTGNGCTTNQADIDSNQTMLLVGSKPTVTIATPTGVSIAAGQYSEAIDVTIAADTAGPLTMVSFPINVSLTGAGSTGTLAVATGGSFPVIVKDANNNTAGLSATGNFSSGTGGIITVTLNSTTGYLLTAGQSQTFRVYVPIASITSGGSATWYNRINTNLVASSGFVWADTAGGATVTTTDITSKIYNYPSTQSAVVQQ